jgi:hypothetical protein
MRKVGHFPGYRRAERDEGAGSLFKEKVSSLFFLREVLKNGIVFIGNMKKIILSVAVLIGAACASQAGGIHFGFNFGLPLPPLPVPAVVAPRVVYQTPAPVYSTPVYNAPAPLCQAPAVVYSAPAVCAPQVYYPPAPTVYFGYGRGWYGSHYHGHYAYGHGHYAYGHGHYAYHGSQGAHHGHR